MGDNRSDLPEGTDEIIEGASGATRDPLLPAGSAAAGSTGGGDEAVVVADTALVTEQEIPAPRADAERPVTGSGSPQGGLAQRLRDGGGRLSGQAADKARGLLGQGLERSAEALANVGRLVGDTATGLDERLGPEYGDYARRAAEAIENTANSLASKDPDELIEDTREFVRKSPGVALAGAAIVGFALARLIKTGLDTGRNDDEDEEA
jgi:hypothetical protein